MFISILKQKNISLLLFIIFCLLIIFDLYINVSRLNNLWEIFELQMLELSIFIMGSTSFWLLWSTKVREKKNYKMYEDKLQAVENDRDLWKEKSAKFNQEFQSYIESHFVKWNLTETEKDIGIYLLKGLSFKEIADLRSVSEKTIRNQALNIYGKSSLHGRHELAAYFLEELL